MSIADLYKKGGTRPTGGGKGRPSSGGTSPIAALYRGKGGAAPTVKSEAIAGEVDSTDIAKSEKTIANHLKKITDSDAPEGEKKSAKKKSAGEQAKGGFMKVLEALDLPRAVVVAGEHQLARLNPHGKTITKVQDKYGNVGKEGDVLTNDDGTTSVIGPDKVEQGIRPSFREDVKKHIGVGQIVQESEQGAKLPINVRRALGFIGDVALDPLSYVAPEKAIAEAGGKAGIAAKLAEAGHEAAAAKVLRKGVSGATREELKSVGIRGGLYFNVPGTGHVANRAANVFGKKIGVKQIRLLEHGGVASVLPRLLQKGGGALLDSSKVVQFLGKHAAGKNAVLKADLRSGDPSKAIPALHALQSFNAGPLKGAGFEAMKGAQIEALIGDAEKKGVSLSDLKHAVAGDPEAAARAVEKGVDLDAHKAWWRSMREEANAIAADDFIRDAGDNYVARIRGQEPRAKLGGAAGTGGPAAHTRQTFEHVRAKAGEDWMGYELHEPGVEIDGVKAKSVEQQIDDINVKVFGGKEAVPLYEDDYRKVVGAYLGGVSKRVGEKYTERLLFEKGVIRDRYAAKRPSARYTRKMAKAQKLAVEAEDLVGQEQLANAELSRAQRLLDTHMATATDEVTAAGAESRRQAEVLQRAVDEAAAAKESVSARVQQRLGIVREAQQRVTTVIGETNHPYERYTDLVDARQGLQDRIDRLNDAIEDGSAIAKEQAKNPALRGEVQARMDRLQQEIEQLEAHPVVDSRLTLDELQDQLEDLQLQQMDGKEVRAEMRRLDQEMNGLNDQLDKLGAHPRVTSGLREGLAMAEGKAASIRRLQVTAQSAPDPAMADDATRELQSLLKGRTYGPEEPLPTISEFEVVKELDKLDVQAELHRRELERWGVDPDEPPGRPLPDIEHDIVMFKPHYETALQRAKVWREAHTRATLWANTPLHQDAVEAAEVIKRLKQQSGWSGLDEVNEQVAALRDHLMDLQKEHYARRAYEGQILPENLAGTQAQVRQQINRVQKAREALGVEWNIYDHKLAKMEQELSALKANSDGVLEHADRAATRFGPEEGGTQKTRWWHYTDAEDVNMLNEPSASRQANTWAGLHGADNPTSSSYMGKNHIVFEIDSDRFKVYAEDPLNLGEQFPNPQTEVDMEGGDLASTYGIPHSLGEATQQADMWRAAWDREVITAEMMAEQNPRYAYQWNEVAEIMAESTDEEPIDIIDAISHVWEGDAAETFDADMLGVNGDGIAHPNLPAFALVHEQLPKLRAEVRQQVREAYRAQMLDEGHDVVLYWNVSENAGESVGGGPHWSIIVTNPSAARIVETEGDEVFKGWDFQQYSDYIESRAETGVDRRLLAETEEALEAQKGIVNQAEAAWSDAQDIAADNQDRLRQIEQMVTAEVGTLTERARALAADEYNLRHEAAAALERANSAEVKAAGPLIEQTMKLEAARTMAEAKLAQLGAKRLEAQQLARLSMDKAVGSFAERAVDALHDGMHAWGSDKMVPEHVADALVDLEKVVTPEGMTKFLNYHDKALGLWKAYAIATPGFHFRNFFGGVFNNYLAGVDVGTTRRVMKAHHQYTTAFKKSLNVEEALTHVKDARIRDAYGQVVNSGLISGGGQISHEIVRGLTSKRTINPLSTNFVPLRGSAKVGEDVEAVLRGTLAVDTLLKGGTMDDAIGAVFKYHFNYDDLSTFEKGFAKRVVPFYTWTRKNFTLQMEQLIRQPGKYKKYLDVKRNIEFGTRDEQLKPSYFDQQLGIQLPFKAGGQSNYLLPDIPFKALAMDKPSEFLSSGSPFVKTPMELWAKKQFFADLPISDKKEIAPAAWQKIPGLMAGLGAIGKARKDKNGHWLMSGKDTYLVEQMVTPLGRARRLFPSEAKYEQRRATTALSFAFGVGVRTNTVQGQYSELRRRDRELTAVIADLQDRGYIKKKESAT